MIFFWGGRTPPLPGLFISLILVLNGMSFEGQIRKLSDKLATKNSRGGESHGMPLILHTFYSNTFYCVLKGFIYTLARRVLRGRAQSGDSPNLEIQHLDTKTQWKKEGGKRPRNFTYINTWEVCSNFGHPVQISDIYLSS